MFLNQVILNIFAQINYNMKKIALIMATAFMVLACNNLKENEYSISGQVDGMENGKKVFVEIQSETGMVAKDTGVVENGKFEIKGITEEIDLGFIRIEDENTSLPFILEKGAITVVIKKDTIQNSTVGGTYNNDKLQSFNTETKVISEKIMKYQQANTERIKEARAANDTVTINQVMKEFNGFQEEMNGLSVKFVKENNKAYLSLLLLENFLVRNYLPVEEIKGYFETIDKSLLGTKSAANIKKAIDGNAGNAIGAAATEFSGPNPDGKIITLKESLGKVTIIDFWASWCGPCRMENPNVVAIYNEFHDKGLNIIGVSLDKDETKWKEAIAKDGLTWTHVSNLKFWDEPIAKLYSVESIPATFILDENGIIVAKDLRGDALKAKIKELLEVK